MCLARGCFSSIPPRSQALRLKFQSPWKVQTPPTLMSLAKLQYANDNADSLCRRRAKCGDRNYMKVRSRRVKFFQSLFEAFHLRKSFAHRLFFQNTDCAFWEGSKFQKPFLMQMGRWLQNHRSHKPPDALFLFPTQ